LLTVAPVRVWTPSPVGGARRGVCWAWGSGCVHAVVPSGSCRSRHISPVVMSLVSRLGELPYDTLTLKASACGRRSAPIEWTSPGPLLLTHRDLYDPAIEDG